MDNAVIIFLVSSAVIIVGILIFRKGSFEAALKALGIKVRFKGNNASVRSKPKNNADSDAQLGPNANASFTQSDRSVRIGHDAKNVTINTGENNR